MDLTHRNRVEYSRLSRLEIQRCGPPSPAGRANVAHPSCSFTEKGDKKSLPAVGGYLQAGLTAERACTRAVVGVPISPLLHQYG